MSDYSTALKLAADDDDQSMAHAARIIVESSDAVVFADMIILRSSGRRLLCQVIDPSPGAHRCEQEYEVLVENARRVLEASPLNAKLPALPRRWRVVESGADGLIERWHCR